MNAASAPPSRLVIEPVSDRAIVPLDLSAGSDFLATGDFASSAFVVSSAVSATAFFVSPTSLAQA